MEVLSPSPEHFLFNLFYYRGFPRNIPLEGKVFYYKMPSVLKKQSRVGEGEEQREPSDTDGGNGK